MKVMVGYPPIESDKGVPLLSQNRQFQWFNKPTYIYPMVPAYAATMAKLHGHETAWADGIAENWSFERFVSEYKSFAPDLILIEAKTPIIKYYWNAIRILKKTRPECLIAVCGDHVTALPEETLRNSSADYVLTGGDYDFLLIDLLKHLNNSRSSIATSDVSSSFTSLPEKNQGIPAGIYYRDGDNIASTGPFELNHNLNEL
ncbi:MAG: cobalamin-dependent protein, partial [Lentisphaerae bacterium]|nr:cobalamin-dependent protein [Lentisphaerota bacterium]